MGLTWEKYGVPIVSVILAIIGLVWLVSTWPNRDTAPSPFLDKLGCRYPKLQISARNVPQMDDDDDPQKANLYFQLAVWIDGGRNAGWKSRSLKKHNESQFFQDEQFKSEIIKITRKNQYKKWIVFDPVDAVMEVKHCWFDCSKTFENWESMALRFWDSDDNHIFSNDDRVATFYYVYHKEIVENSGGVLFNTINDCALSVKDDKKFNRGWFTEKGKTRYEKGLCMEDDDWKKKFEVRMVFYCE